MILRRWRFWPRQPRRAFKPHSINVQPLESRILPAVASIVSVVATQDVKITGDDAANDITITFGTNLVTITGNGGTQVKLGNSAPTVTVEIPLPPAQGAMIRRDLILEMRGGNDAVEIETTNLPVTIGRNARIDMGVGDDHLEVYAGQGATFQVNGFFLATLGPASLPSRPLPLPTDNDCASIEDIDVTGNVSVKGGAGDDVIEVAEVDGLANLSVDGGTGNDKLYIQDGHFEGNAKLDGSHQNDTIFWEDVGVDGNASLSGGTNDDVLIVLGGHVEGNATIAGGANNDLIFVELIDVSGISRLNGDAGNDRVVITSGTFDDDLMVNLGSGNDSLHLVIASITLGAGATVNLNGSSGTADILETTVALPLAGVTTTGFETIGVDAAVPDVLDEEAIIDAVDSAYFALLEALDDCFEPLIIPDAT